MRKCAFFAYGDSEGPDQHTHSQLIWTFAPSLSTHRIIAKPLIRYRTSWTGLDLYCSHMTTSTFSYGKTRIFFVCRPLIHSIWAAPLKNVYFVKRITKGWISWCIFVVGYEPSLSTYKIIIQSRIYPDTSLQKKSSHTVH